MDCDSGGLPDVAGVVGEHGGEAGTRADLATQVEDRVAQLTDDPRQFLAKAKQVWPEGLWGLRCHVVDEIPQGRDFLGNSVVDLAREALPLLGCRKGAYLVEEESSIEAYGIGVGY